MYFNNHKWNIDNVVLKEMFYLIYNWYVIIFGQEFNTQLYIKFNNIHIMNIVTPWIWPVYFTIGTYNILLLLACFETKRFCDTFKRRNLNCKTYKNVV